MASSLDMALDDIVRKSKKVRSGGGSGSRGRGGRVGSGRGGRVGSRGGGAGVGGGGGGGQPFHFGSGPGPDRRFGGRRVLRPGPYLRPPVPAMGSFFQQAAMAAVEPKFVPAGSGGGGVGTRLYVSNLDYGVTNQDIKVLFSDVGELKRCSIHYDLSGRSKGTAEVVYERHGDALEAIRRYNNVDLDGRPIRIELIGVRIMPAPLPLPLPAPAATSNMIRRPNLPFNFQSGGESIRGRRPTRGGRSTFGKDQGPGRAVGQVQQQDFGRHRKLITFEELDAELDRYRFGAMQIN